MCRSREFWESRYTNTKPRRDHFQNAWMFVELNLVWARFLSWTKKPWLGYAEGFLNRQCLKRFSARPPLRAEMGPAKDLSWRKCAWDGAARLILKMKNYHWSFFFLKIRKRIWATWSSVALASTARISLGFWKASNSLVHISLFCHPMRFVHFFVFDFIAIGERNWHSGVCW